MTDPMKLPATTNVNLYSGFRPNPFLRGFGCSQPIPFNFTPEDNPSTFNQATIKNSAQTNFMEKTGNKKAPKAPRPPRPAPKRK